MPHDGLFFVHRSPVLGGGHFRSTGEPILVVVTRPTPSSPVRGPPLTGEAVRGVGGCHLLWPRPESCGRHRSVLDGCCVWEGPEADVPRNFQERMSSMVALFANKKIPAVALFLATRLSTVFPQVVEIVSLCPGLSPGLPIEDSGCRHNRYSDKQANRGDVVTRAVWLSTARARRGKTSASSRFWRVSCGRSTTSSRRTIAALSRRG